MVDNVEFHIMYTEEFRHDNDICGDCWNFKTDRCPYKITQRTSSMACDCDEYEE